MPLRLRYEERIRSGVAVLNRRSLLQALASLPLVSVGCAEVHGQGAPIRVGVLHALSGSLAASGSAVAEATRFAVDALNGRIPGQVQSPHGPGLLGRPVEAVVVDGGDSDAQFAAQAQALLDSGIRVIFGCWTSSSRKAVLPIIEAGRAFLFYPVQHEGLERSPNALYLGALPNQQLLPALRWGVSTFGPRVALVGSDYVYPRVAHAILRDQMAALGLEVVYEAYLPLAGDGLPARARDLVAELRAARPSFVASTLNGLPGNLAFHDALRAQAPRPPVISFSVAEPEGRALQAAGLSMEGDFAAWTHFAANPEPVGTRFRADLRAWRRQQGLVGVAEISDPMAAAIASVLLWADAVRDDPAALDDGERLGQSLRGRSVIGPQGEVHVDAHSPHTWARPMVGRFGPGNGLSTVHAAVDLTPPMPFPGFRTTEAWTALLDGLAGPRLSAEVGPG
jgi:urea transport system substrate-binding protein